MRILFAETPISFFAIRSTYFNPVSSASSIFNQKVINEGYGFEKLAKNSFTAPISGLYWFHVTIGIPPGSFANVSFQETPSLLYFHRNHSVFASGPGMLARNALVNMTAGSTVTLVTSYPLYSDNSTHLSFGGLLLNHLMDPVVAFTFHRSAILTVSENCFNTPYNDILLDTHNGWNKTTNNYVVQVAGLYVLSISTTSMYCSLDRSHFMYNDNFFAPIYFISPTINGEDTFAGTIVLYLDQNARIGSSFCSDYTNRFDMSLSGFLLSPKNIQPVAFSAFRSSGASGPLDPINYDDIQINIGNGWNVTTSRFTAPYAGVYYVYMAALCNLYQPMKIELLLNGMAVTSFVSYNAATEARYDQRNYDFILRLVKNDQLRLSLPAGFGFFSNNNRHMWISIFRVHA